MCKDLCRRRRSSRPRRTVQVQCNVVSSAVELATVGKVVVFDVLGQPVLGRVRRLLGEGKVGRLELGLEDVVLEVVTVAVVALDFAELHILVVEVLPELGLAERVLLSVGRVVSTLADTVKWHLVRK